MPECLHLQITDFVELILYFKIHKLNDSEMSGQPKGTTTVETEVTRFN